MYMMKTKGWVEVICGSMFSGKSEELIRRVRQAMYGNLSTIVFKPKIDDRYATDSVVTHNQSTIKAVTVTSAQEILDYVKRDIQIVAIDEAQFLDNGIVEVVDQLATKGLRVIVAGLDTDFRAEPFGSMPTLMARGELLTKLNAICPICSSPASRTQRLINGRPAAYDDPIILVGASERYEPRCRHHHEVPGRAV